VENWQQTKLDPQTLQRMRLLAYGVLAKQGEVEVKIPNPAKLIRLAPGEASVITRDVCEQLFPRLMSEPVVVHLSISDQKICPDLEGVGSRLGLDLSQFSELPDVMAIDIGEDRWRLVFVEVVHSDGPVTELRRQALMKIAAELGFPEEQVTMITAFEDRKSAALKKRLSEIAWGTSVWLRSEPDRIINFGTCS